MEHCKFRVVDKCKNEECELLICIGTENCIHFQAEPKEKLEDTIPKWKIDKAIKEMERYSTSFEYANKHDLASAVDYCIGVIERNIGEAE